MTPKRLVLGNRVVCISLLLAFTWVAAAGADPVAEPKLEGVWAGTLSVGAVKLRLVFDLKKSPDGEWAATMDCLDQNASNLKIDVVTQDQKC